MALWNIDLLFLILLYQLLCWLSEREVHDIYIDLSLPSTTHTPFKLFLLNLPFSTITWLTYYLSNGSWRISSHVTHTTPSLLSLESPKLYTKLANITIFYDLPSFLTCVHWCSVNKFTLNISKCHSICYSLITFPISFPYCLHVQRLSLLGSP